MLPKALPIFFICFVSKSLAVVQASSYRFFTEHQALATFDVDSVDPEPMSLALPQDELCDESDNCVAGQCVADKVTGNRVCQCDNGAFRYWLPVPGLNVCLRCRPLNATCSLNEECQCKDANAVCVGASGARKGRCQCRWPLKADNATECPAFSDQRCKADSECATSIRYLDSNGNPIVPPAASATCVTSETGVHVRPAVDSSVIDPVPTLDELIVPEPRGINRTTTHGCRCPEGFKAALNDSFACQDIDECSEARRNPCMPRPVENAEVTCVNTIGGYKCECNSEFAIGQGMPPHGICCKSGFLPCLDSSKCVPFNRLCNGVPECEHDCSDELYPFCNFNTRRAFPDFLRYPQCYDTFNPDHIDPITSKAIEIPPPVASALNNSSPVNETEPMELLPLGAALSSETESPPTNIPTLPANLTAAKLLGYVLV